MDQLNTLDKTFHLIMKRMVETGQAPHYTEIAKELGVSMDEGRKTLHPLYAKRIHGWLAPGTDEGILPLPDLLKLFSGRMFRRRLDPDYFSRMREYGVEWISTLQDIGKTGPFWSPKT